MMKFFDKRSTSEIGHSNNVHRKDIDGLRAIAVIAVIIFHLGYLPNGYLGVDVFFVISGYLITRIIYNEVLNGTFSIVNFYIRRIRRIIPLVVFSIFISLIIGLFAMLPDDLENLSQSVIATNLMANNILLLITTGNYWNTVNEFKPLMHTWSLGVEEQFYIILPLILLLFAKKIKWIFPVLSILAIFSFFLFISPFGSSASKFYLIQYRFFEIAIGGIVGILFKQKVANLPFSIFSFLSILFLLIYPLNISGSITLILIVAFSSIFMISKSSKIEEIILENDFMQFVGKISFSLYIWHQIVFAFGRYFVFEDPKSPFSVLLLLIVTALLSIISYNCIETPFRDRNKMSFKSVLIVVGSMTVLTFGGSFYLYSKKGIIRDVPELKLYKSVSYSGNIHITYNERIYKYSNDFEDNNRRKILIVGNSFARDWANVLLETPLKDSIEISYLVNLESGENVQSKLNKADIIYFSELKLSELSQLKEKYGFDSEKVWNVGTKNFGKNNGYFYNRKKDSEYCKQRTALDAGFLEKNAELKAEWKDRYIDLIGLMIDNDNKVPVFTNDCKFISQDCRHLTQFGAKYFALLLYDQKLSGIKK